LLRLCHGCGSTLCDWSDRTVWQHPPTPPSRKIFSSDLGESHGLAGLAYATDGRFASWTFHPFIEYFRPVNEKNNDGYCNRFQKFFSLSLEGMVILNHSLKCKIPIKYWRIPLILRWQVVRRSMSYLYGSLITLWLNAVHCCISDSSTVRRSIGRTDRRRHRLRNAI